MKLDSKNFTDFCKHLKWTDVKHLQKQKRWFLVAGIVGALNSLNLLLNDILLVFNVIRVLLVID